jgi:hypothetical protein
MEGIREYAVELVRSNYADFGPSLAAEMLLSKHQLKVSRETLRKWMMSDGLWLSRRQRRSFHQPRLRREAFGELIQIDGSDHRWFENRGDACTLLVFIDDATSRLVQLRFVVSESTDSYLSPVHTYVVAFGCPVAFYSDKHTVFRINRSNAPGGTGMTQFGRALAELNIEIICANSSQAKGRVERVNRTLQDRLVKELRLANISDIDAGNAFLPSFLLTHNERRVSTRNAGGRYTGLTMFPKSPPNQQQWLKQPPGKHSVNSQHLVNAPALNFPKPRFRGVIPTIARNRMSMSASPLLATVDFSGHGISPSSKRLRVTNSHLLGDSSCARVRVQLRG